MTDEELLRYSRHILLDEIGIEGQERIRSARILIVGAGGLGSPAALYLAASGIGHITLVDADEVDLTNLQRQIAHTTDRVGRRKVDSAREAMEAINPWCQVEAIGQRADADLLDRYVPASTVVLDCTDNYRTRQMINAACVRHAVPLVSASALRFDGQLLVVHPADPESACYACIFDPAHQPEEAQCSTMGVLAPMVGIMGTLQALETLKCVVGLPVRPGELRILDGLQMRWTDIRIPRTPDCPVCSCKKHSET